MSNITLNSALMGATPSGWQCPVCRAVMSPTFPMCVYCKPLPEEQRKAVPSGWPVPKIGSGCVSTEGQADLFNGDSRYE